MESFYSSSLQESNFSILNQGTLDTSLTEIPFPENAYNYIGTGGPSILSNVIGMNKDVAKDLLQSEGWTFYTGYQAYPDGLFSGQGNNPGPSTGINTVAAVYEFEPYRPLPVGTENTGQQIVIYYWWE